MKNTTLLLVSIIILFIIGGIFFVKTGNGNKNSNTLTGNVVVNGGGGGNVVNGGGGGSGGGIGKATGEEVQKVVLGMKNYNYYPSEVKVKAGTPVSISLEDSVFGCLRALSIRELGVGKYLRTASDTLDFLPTQKGVFKISCTMGMGYGKLIVE